MMDAQQYETKTTQASVGGKPILLTSRTPVFPSDEKRREVKKSIEHALYQIFEKYS